MRALDAAGWALAALLAASCAWHGARLARGGSGFATLPVFVPVSLEYEKRMRAERGQPAGRGGEEAFALAEGLLALPELGDLAAKDPTLRGKVEALRETRAALLDARGRRHALNIALMDVGVAVARELEPAQWDRIHMRRDEVRGKAEAEVFDRLLERLR